MPILTAIMVGVIFAVSTYLLLGRELKAVCMGVFLLGHAANLAILAASGSPIRDTGDWRHPPVLLSHVENLDVYADPLPQALILTAIVIGFAVQAFLLTLLVVTWRRNSTLQTASLAIDEGSGDGHAARLEAH